MEYSILIEKDPESGWLVGQCKQIPGALSQGKDLDELMANMREAIELMIEENEATVMASMVGRQYSERTLSVRV